MNNTATNTATCPTVRKQIGKTTYIVRVHFSETAKETMEDKIKRMLREEVRKMWLLFEFDEKVLDNLSLVEQYGDSYEKHTYIGKERYTIYRYALGECFHEFGIPGEATGEIYNVDVYVSGQMPIYDYGEEIVED